MWNQTQHCCKLQPERQRACGLEWAQIKSLYSSIRVFASVSKTYKLDFFFFYAFVTVFLAGVEPEMAISVSDNWNAFEPETANYILSNFWSSNVQQHEVRSHLKCLSWNVRTPCVTEPWEDPSSCTFLASLPPLSTSSISSFRTSNGRWEEGFVYRDEPALVVVCLWCAPCVLLHPPSLSPIGVFSLFLIFSEAFFFVRATSLNGTMQPSVKLKLLVSLESLKRRFYTCMHSRTLPYAIDIVN